MKKLICVTLALMMVLSLSVAAFAAGTTVYCDAPDWEACYVYTWDANNKACTGDWPGTAMTKNADGLWEFEVPEGAVNIIFNIGSDAAKTADLSMPTDSKVKYDVAGKAWAEVSQKVEVKESYSVAGTATLCGVDWKPEATENNMTKGSDGLWVKEYKNIAAGEHKFKVTDGSWMNSWGDTADAEGNIIFTLEKAGDVTIKFDAAKKIVTLIADGKTTTYGGETGDSGNTGDTGNTGDSGNTGNTGNTGNSGNTGNTGNTGTNTGKSYTLYVKVPTTWTKVNAYTWDPEDLGTWPGATMQKSGEWYTATIKGTMKNLVLSGGETAQKTENITLPGNKNVWIVVDASNKFTVSEKAPSGSSTNTGSIDDIKVTGTPSEYRVVGNAEFMGNWDVNSDKGRMNEVEPGVYRVKFKNVPKGEYQMKVTKNKSWDTCWGDNGGNFNFNVAQTGDIVVTFTLKGNQGLITVQGTNVVGTDDIPMVGFVALLVLAATTTVVLVVNRKKFI